ncbi:MAG: hypothetical protein SGBAC_009279, partial [Bacillariaceae sp.]
RLALGFIYGDGKSWLHWEARIDIDVGCPKNQVFWYNGQWLVIVGVHSRYNGNLKIIQLKYPDADVNHQILTDQQFAGAYFDPDALAAITALIQGNRSAADPQAAHPQRTLNPDQQRLLNHMMM